MYRNEGASDLLHCACRYFRPHLRIDVLGFVALNLFGIIHTDILRDEDFTYEIYDACLMIRNPLGNLKPGVRYGRTSCCEVLILLTTHLPH